MLRDNGFSPLGIPRLRGFVYTIAAIDRGGADGRLIIDARNGRIIRFLPAYRMGGDNYYEEQSALRGPLHGSAAAGPSAAGPPGAGPCPGRAAAVTAGSSCCEPHGADAEGQSARLQTCYRADQAGGRACAEVGRGAGGRPGDNRLGSSQARPADCTDPGHALDAGAGVTSTVVPAFAGTTNKKTPRSSRGVFHCGKLRAIRARLRRPGSGRRPCRAARPATGGRRPVRPSSHSSAWRETARGRD